MADIETGTIKMGGLFSPKIKVSYMTKLERPTSDGEIKSISMHNFKDGTPIGDLEYTRAGTFVKLDSFKIGDWSNPKLAEGLLKKFLTIVKKQGVNMVEAEVYDVDNKMHTKLTLLKSRGFKVESVSSVTGYNQYILRLAL